MSLKGSRIDGVQTLCPLAVESALLLFAAKHKRSQADAQEKRDDDGSVLTERGFDRQEMTRELLFIQVLSPLGRLQPNETFPVERGV